MPQGMRFVAKYVQSSILHAPKHSSKNSFEPSEPTVPETKTSGWSANACTHNTQSLAPLFWAPSMGLEIYIHTTHNFPNIHNSEWKCSAFSKFLTTVVVELLISLYTRDPQIVSALLHFIWLFLFYLFIINSYIFSFSFLKKCRIFSLKHTPRLPKM